jgi:hypothetical protein
MYYTIQPLVKVVPKIDHKYRQQNIDCKIVPAFILHLRAAAGSNSTYK